MENVVADGRGGQEGLAQEDRRRDVGAGGSPSPPAKVATSEAERTAARRMGHALGCPCNFCRNIRKLVEATIDPPEEKKRKHA